MEPFTVLLIDDDPGVTSLLQCVFSDIPGVVFHAAANAASGLEMTKDLRPDLVLLDLGLPDIPGLTLLDQLLQLDPALDVIVITGLYSVEAAVTAVQKGASDYLTKPLSLDQFAEKIRSRTACGVRLKKHIPDPTDNVRRTQEIIGLSPALLTLLSRVERIGPHFRTALVSGDTGTGKELIARALHDASSFAEGPFVTCNCAAIVESLFESELFGYQKGAFTGAAQDKAGVIEHASGGTLFLDEIGELPFTTQAKLLRTLQSREIQRVGSPVPRKVDVRVVAATNRNLREMVAAGTFREDLYFRLAMIELKVPRLADRKEDVPLLLNHFLDKFSEMYGIPRRRLSPRARAAILKHSWPGNIRELENTIAYCCMMCRDEQIDVIHFPERLRKALADISLEDPGEPVMLSMDEMRNQYIAHVLASVSGNRTKAAQILGIGRNTLHRYLKKPHQGSDDKEITQEFCHAANAL